VWLRVDFAPPGYEVTTGIGEIGVVGLLRNDSVHGLLEVGHQLPGAGVEGIFGRNQIAYRKNRC
jgi:hypothetical protein